jgi:hypothetical protein
MRSSSYNNYDYCQMQYFITYNLGWSPDSNKRADLGTMAHKVMETMAKFKKFHQDNPRKKYLEIEDDALGKIKVDKNRLLTKEFLHEIADLSFDKYRLQFTKHRWSNNDRKEVKQIVDIFINWNHGQFDPRFRHIHHAEPHFDIPIEEDWAKFEYEINGKTVVGQLAIKGTIDLVTLVNDDTIEVIDWKTGRRKNWTTGEEKDFKKLNNDPQLLLYFYAISKLYPDYPNRVMSIFFCKNPDGEYDPKPFSLCFDKSDEEKFLVMLRKRFEEIKANNFPKPLDSTRKNFKCQKMCHFCKNNWKDTDENMCIFIEKHIKQHGIEETIKRCTKPGFDIGFYESPG